VRAGAAKKEETLMPRPSTRSYLIEAVPGEPAVAFVQYRGILVTIASVRLGGCV
jgi:hypothetical protein